MKPIRRIAVLGAGTMGSRIAAHFANAGIPALLLDIVLPGQPNRNAAALKGIENAAKQKARRIFYRSRLVAGQARQSSKTILPALPNATGSSKRSSKISRSSANLWQESTRSAKPDAILSTNTSGIPLAQISEGFSAEFRRHFLGTHFFNPPRYLHLLELIPGPETRPGDPANSSPAFCRPPPRQRRRASARTRRTSSPTASAASSARTVQKIMVEDDYTIEEVDALPGPLIGLPQQRQFPAARHRRPRRLGLSLARICTTRSPTIPGATASCCPSSCKKMMERGWLGEKTRPGILQAGRQGREPRDPSDRLEDAGVPSGAEAAVPSRRSRAADRGSRRAPAHAGRRQGSRRGASSGRCSATSSSIRPR